MKITTALTMNVSHVEVTHESSECDLDTLVDQFIVPMLKAMGFHADTINSRINPYVEPQPIVIRGLKGE